MLTDEEKIAAYIEKNQNPPEPRTAPPTTEEQVEAKAGEKGPLKKSPLQKKEEKEAKEKGEEIPTPPPPPEPEPEPVVGGPPPFIQDSLTAAGNRARATADWMSGLKTPGGVGFLVFVLVFFVWVVVPVNDTGQTRLQLLWGVLTGQVGFSQAIQQQRDTIATGAINQLLPGSFPGTPAPSTTGTGGGQIIPIEYPFVPSFEEF